MCGQFGDHLVAQLLYHLGPWDTFCDSVMISSTSADQFPFSDNDYFPRSYWEVNAVLLIFSLPNVLSWKRISSPYFWSKLSLFHVSSKLSWWFQVLEHKKIFLCSTLAHLSFPSVHKELIPCWKKRKEGNSGRGKVKWDNRFYIISLKAQPWDFSGGPGVENLPCKAEYMDSPCPGTGILLQSN